MRYAWKAAFVAAMVGAMIAGGGLQAALGQAASRSQGNPQATPPQAAKVDPAHAQRLQRMMIPLIEKMNNPIPLEQVKVGILDDTHINAANAGGGSFLVTTGLLQKANDDQLRAILAHEVAHADLGHVAKHELFATGVEVGILLLDQLFPGARAIGPLAGQAALGAYGRPHEHEADAHGVELLRRTGHDGKTLMSHTLAWLEKMEGGGGGGFFATHPATGDRIQAVRRLP